MIQKDLSPPISCRILIINHENIYISKIDILYSTKKLVVREFPILMGEDYSKQKKSTIFSVFEISA
jgi:hypothetical protein